jgi:TolA-binding protein
MKKKNALIVCFCLFAAEIFADEGAAFPKADFAVSFQAGISLYGIRQWDNAAAAFAEARDAAATDDDRAEAAYWLCVAEDAGGRFESALASLDALSHIPGGAARKAEIPYLRGRSFYGLGRYNEAIPQLKSYADSVPADSADNIARKSAALYWTGECLYALGQFDKAQDVFSLIVQQYPQSVKYEASRYRIDLIDQKKIEVELLDLLNQTHEESLKTIEEYQRRERVYTQTLIAYQKRIAALEAILRETQAKTE